MFAWHNDDELFALMKERLYTPVVGDILDAMGYAHQFLPAGIHPLRDDMKIAGRACTVLECDVFEPQKKPFGLLTEALDQLEKNDVYIATGAHTSALWGGTADGGRPQARRGGRGTGRLHAGHPAGAAAEFPGVRPGALGPGFEHPHQRH